MPRKRPGTTHRKPPRLSQLGSAAKGAQDRRNTDAPQNGLDGVLAGIADLLGGSTSNVLTGGLGDLMDHFKQAGHGDVADSWVNPTVETRGLTPKQVEDAVGSDNLVELAQRTGLSREDLLQRLSTAIPATVDRLTPNGQMPTEDEARQRIIES